MNRRALDATDVAAKARARQRFISIMSVVSSILMVVVLAGVESVLILLAANADQSIAIPLYVVAVTFPLVAVGVGVGGALLNRRIRAVAQTPAPAGAIADVLLVPTSATIRRLGLRRYLNVLPVVSLRMAGANVEVTGPDGVKVLARAPRSHFADVRPSMVWIARMPFWGIAAGSGDTAVEFYLNEVAVDLESGELRAKEVAEQVAEALA